MPHITDLFKAILGICETKPLHPNLWSLEGDTVRVKIKQVPDLQKKNGPYYLKGQGLKKSILLFKGENEEYFAFENRCTHMGRKIDPVFGENKLRCCSVNHSTFDYQGNKLSGPARGSIRKYEVYQKEKDLIIQL